MSTKFYALLIWNVKQAGEFKGKTFTVCGHKGNKAK